MGDARIKSSFTRGARRIKSSFFRASCGSLRRIRKEKRKDTPWAVTVAIAAPAIPQRKTITNRRSRMMFVIHATIIAYSGVLLSPRDRRIAAQKLYDVIMGIPAKQIVIYIAAPSITFSGVSNRSSRGRTRRTLRIVSKMPAIAERTSEWAIPRWSPSISPAPKRWEQSRENPCVNPVITPNTSQLGQSALPRDAKASTPTPCPTTIVSTIVYIC